MSGPVRDLTGDSVTGIDVSLPVAGPGARAYAFLVDWHIRLIVALAWFVVGALLYNGRPSLAPPLSNDARWFGTVVAPALAIYLDRKSTRLNSSHLGISYAVFCLKKKNNR